MALGAYHHLLAPDVPLTNHPCPVSSAPAQMLDFPSSGLHPSTSSPDPHYSRPTYLPFRRISLPSAPNLQHRQSIVSTASFDSLFEEPHSAAPTTPVVIRNAVRGPKPRPSSVDVARRAARRRESRVVDGQKEAKRRKVIAEFYETERSYLDGLELIHSHFLAPIIKSLDTPHPLLDRSELTSIFSNFIDIWNLHRSFYVSLTTFLNSSASARPHEPPPPLSPVLLAHFPYLSLYTPFVSSFSDALASYASLLKSSPAFAAFIAQQETDPRCGKLKFRDWLLTIVQRCPRYLLLLKDMIDCTDPDDPEYTSLTAVHTLVSKITMSLNTSLHTHAQTLSLLALQRNTVNLPFQLITPGRTFLRRASLLQMEGSTLKEREFLLFSDCLIWLASADGDVFSDKWNAAGMGSTSASSGGLDALSRTRSEPEVDLLRRTQSLLQLRLNASPWKKVRQSSSGIDDRWIYKGHVELVDLEVVVSVPAADTPERAFELLSPHQSFAVYAVNEEERDEWITAIRNAKSSLLVSFSVMQLNSTLTSSAATNHLRRTLQALPYAPDDSSKPPREKVEHFVPAVWVPDGKTESCMRCGRTFGWRRRRHHCRLCGRCVCGSCSCKTFFIVDPAAKDASSKSARACEACYETVFPLLEQPSEPRVSVTAGTTHSHFTLSGLKSMPSLLLNDVAPSTSSASALMALDIDSPSPRRPQLPRIDSADAEGLAAGDAGAPHVAVAAVRLKPAPRPKSYIQLLEDFHEEGGAGGDYGYAAAAPSSASPSASPRASRFSERTMDETHGVLDERDEDVFNDGRSAAAAPVAVAVDAGSAPSTPRKENTARRHKRFSLPAVALQTSPVTARASQVGGGERRGGQRFSLVLGKGGGVAHHGQDSPGKLFPGLRHSMAAGRLSELLGRGKDT
ncbi:hypothetical protein BC628DRAFT_1312595 [Trametes gibbosa]|uniref:FYVE, RhoGEF and PH domain-containing protein 6 n=1 Tax=Trametes gibbosa TaxID=160864 RepID=A0A6G6FQD5_9APHY|nr:hypothetical protein BC628DRAFT_1312595 [Trametes gibbosa]QIE48488.1 hypothetical protein [Trametes gibbosa]